MSINTARLQELFRAIPDEEAQPALVLLAHPNYDQAEQAYLYASRAMLTSTRESMKVLGNLAISRLELLILAQHAQKEIEGIGRGASVSSLQNDATAFRYASPRSINNFVERLVQSKRLTRESAPDDNRVKRLIPTDILIGDQILIMSPGAAAIEVLFPGSNYIETWRNDHRAFVGFCREAAERRHLLEQHAYHAFRPAVEFEMHDGAFPLMRLFCLSCYETHGRLAANLPIPGNRHEASTSLRISVSQVGKLIDLGIASGLFIDVPLRGKIMFTEHCIMHWRGLTACRISGINQAMLAWKMRQAALAENEHDKPSTPH